MEGEVWITSLNSHSSTFQPATAYSFLSTFALSLPPYIVLLCESVHLVCKNDSLIQEQLPTLAPMLRGGLRPFENSGLRKIFFRGQAQ